MTQTAAPQPPLPTTRRRILAIAFACHPTHSAESRVGWARVLMASQQHDVTVICSSELDDAQLRKLAIADGAHSSIRFLSRPHCRTGSICCASDLLYFVGYRMWHWRVAHLAKRLHEEDPYDLIHQINYCTFREPGYCWRLDVPFVWGPIGGTQYFPVRFLSTSDFYSGVREIARNVVNYLQLNLSPRVRRAGRRSASILAATALAATDIAQALKVSAVVELEAGLSYRPAPSRQSRDTSLPLRILWTGRLRAWKGLPLLLHALARLDTPIRYELRVLGEGSGLARYQKLAQELGIHDSIQWVGWGPYHETLPQYDWADVFAFTSLRDTSGAGLLEALAAGVPIVGLDHQGAADIMTEACAIKIKPSSPSEVIESIATALTRVATDEQLRLKLSHGATAQAGQYVWSDRAPMMEAIYQAAMLSEAVGNEVCQLARETAECERRMDKALLNAVARN